MVGRACRAAVVNQDAFASGALLENMRPIGSAFTESLGDHA